jgi:hypothetical protein
MPERLISLVRACRDRRLLGAQISWRPRQLEVLGAFGGPASSVTVAAGRQGGKTSMAMAAAVHNASMRPDLDRVLPVGRVRHVLVAAPSERQARQNISVAAGMVDASEVLRGLVEVVTSDRIDFALPTGAKSSILALPANSRAIRGMSASMVIADEFAHFNSESLGPANDQRIMEALEPSMSAFGDAGKLLTISTPYGVSGEFARMFEQAEAGLLPGAVALQFAAWELNESLDSDAWRERQIARLGLTAFQTEHAALFVTPGASMIDLDGLDWASGPADPGHPAQWTWVAALDMATVRDRAGYALIGVHRNRPDELVLGPVGAIDPLDKRTRSLEARRAHENAVLDEIADRLEPYQPARVYTDTFLGPEVKSYLGRRGFHVEVVNVTAQVQTEGFNSLKARIEDGSLLLWRCAQLLEDLRRISLRSNERVMLPRYAGGHCDAAAALALAVRHFTPSLRSRPVALPTQLPVSVMRDYGSSPLDNPGWLGGIDRW